MSITMKKYWSALWHFQPALLKIIRCAAQCSLSTKSEQAALTQTISLSAISARLDFKNTVLWQEAHTFLRVVFPLNLRV